jgi:putative oxidoreductase
MTPLPGINHTNGVGGINGADIGLIPARTSLGATMLYHGLAKLRADSRQPTAAAFESLGIRPGRFWSLATGIAESFAGVAMVLGIFTRPAALAVLATQSVAIAKVHSPKGFENAKGGFEFNLALMAIATAVLVAGPGRLSLGSVIERALTRRTLVDRVLRRRRRRVVSRLLALFA